MASETPACPETRKALTFRGLPFDEQIIKDLGSEHPSGGADWIRWADQHGIARETKAGKKSVKFEKLMAATVKQLKPTKLKVGAKIGDGRYSLVYALASDPKQTIKITGDVTDAVTWARVLKLREDGSLTPANSGSLSEVSCVLRVPHPVPGQNQDLFLVVAPRYKPLSQKASSFVSALMSVMEHGWPTGKETLLQISRHHLGDEWLAEVRSRGGKDWLDLLEEEVKAWLETKGLGPLSEEDIVHDPRVVKDHFEFIIEAFASKLPGCGAHADHLVQTLMTLAKHGLYPRDLHADQIMIDDSGPKPRWRIVDLGLTTMLDAKQAIHDVDLRKA